MSQMGHSRRSDAPQGFAYVRCPPIATELMHCAIWREVPKDDISLWAQAAKLFGGRPGSSAVAVVANCIARAP
jgi:hypothetical protein